VRDQVASVHLKNINSLPVMGKFPGLIQGHHLPVLISGVQDQIPHGYRCQWWGPAAKESDIAAMNKVYLQVCLLEYSVTMLHDRNSIALIQITLLLHVI
jgi:hypothetical protein